MAIRNFIPVKGLKQDILSSDSESVQNELNSVDFTINSTQSTYLPEFLTTEYINNLFSAFEEAEGYWEQIKRLVEKYHLKFESIPLPDSLIDTNIFDELNQTDATISTPSDNNVTYQGMVNIKNGTLNFRSEPNGEIIGSIPKGAKLKILENNLSGEWIKVEIDGKEGFVHSSYVNIEKIIPTNIEATTTPTSNETVSNYNKTSNYTKAVVNINNGSLNLRSEPNGEIIGSIDKNSELKILENNSNSNWVKVEIDGKEGFVYKEYLKIDNQPQVKEPNLVVTPLNSNQEIYGTVNINSGNLNIRSSPNGEIIGSLSKDSEIKILDNTTNSNWTKISVDGKEAYVYSKYIKIN